MMFYTYAHYTPDTKQLFYIGKGQRKRFKQSYARTTWWHNKVKKHGGFEAVILAYWKTEQEAFEHEKFLIALFKPQLVNLSSGGEGAAGVKRSKKACEAVSKALKGRPLTEERKKNISKALTGRKLDPATAQKSREHLEKIRQAQKKKVLCLTDGKVYESVTDASKQLGIDASSIVKVCKGKMKKAGKKEFTYV